MNWSLAEMVALCYHLSYAASAGKAFGCSCSGRPDRRRSRTSAPLPVRWNIWAQLGRLVDVHPRWAKPNVLALRKSRAKPLSELVATVGTREGDARLNATTLRAIPFPHFSPHPTRTGFLVRTEADGTTSVGRFVESRHLFARRSRAHRGRTFAKANLRASRARLGLDRQTDSCRVCGAEWSREKHLLSRVPCRIRAFNLSTRMSSRCTLNIDAYRAARIADEVRRT